MFHYDELTQANVSSNVNYMEVNAGWSQTPVAYLPGDSSMEISMTSGQFNADLFSMSNARTFAHDDEFYIPVSKRYVPTTTAGEGDAVAYTIELEEEPVEGSVTISGMPADAVTGVEKKQDKWAVTFETDAALAADEEVEVNYNITNEASMSIKVDNKSAAVGQAVCKWPVYGAGDDCTENAIKGYVVIRIFKARVTQMPNFDTSYKSTSTNAVTFSAMDAKRNDGAIYMMGYVPAQ